MTRRDPIALDEFIRQERDAILRNWEQRVRRAVEAAQGQSATAVLDHLPDLLDAIAQRASGAPPQGASQARMSARHAAERLDQGYGLAEVVMEYVELRTCIFERLEELGLEIPPVQSRQLHRAIDDALRETSRRYVTAHEKMLRALELLAGRGTPGHRIEEVLADILHALKEAAGAEVDSIAVLLVEDDGRLHVRASIGFEEVQASSFSLGIGEGFSGRIAATRQPLLLHDAANESFIATPAIRQRGTRALYGVPLMDEGRAIGVAHMGSCAAHSFSEEDMMLFRAMCDRATMAIVRARFVEALERTSRFREQFIAVLGHDLRSPLYTVIGSVDLLMRDPTPSVDRIRTALPRIARSAARMERLITQLLDFTRARLGGGFTLERASFSLTKLVREVADEQLPLLSRRTLDVEGEEVVSAWDRDRLSQVLMNLIGNAVQHSPDGSRIRVTVRRDADRAVVDVWNEGPPIPTGRRLFEPFERATEGGGGLGLGLYIAHEIVKAHAGALTARSDATGTTFTVQLPLTATRPQVVEAH